MIKHIQELTFYETKETASSNSLAKNIKQEMHIKMMSNTTTFI